MDLYISQELNQADKNYIRNKMVEFNLMYFPDDLKGRYQEVNLYLKNGDGQIFGGIISEICWNWMEVEYLFVDEQLRRLGYFEVYGVIQNAGGHTHYYLKKDF
ncbi:GNAT family N-acetyltransferase [Paenibacillus medicaginis]|uniref:GNAT family N-acetyltransferase n=1 Tax=Paenibacillus medicaginis TaxID=1470560 RepID=A0ABV5C0P3_9BACL